MKISSFSEKNQSLSPTLLQAKLVLVLTHFILQINQIWVLNRPQEFEKKVKMMGEKPILVIYAEDRNNIFSRDCSIKPLFQATMFAKKLPHLRTKNSH